MNIPHRVCSSSAHYRRSRPRRASLIAALLAMAGLSGLSGIAVAGDSAAGTAKVWEVADGGKGHSATQRIQGAIDACAEVGGGRVDVPAGLYEMTPIDLKSNVELHLAKGTILRFSRSIADYPLMWIDDGSGRQAGCKSPINADGATNISITGEGVIDGQGDAWRSVKKAKLRPDDWAKLIKSGGVLNEKKSEWYPSAVVRDGGHDLEKVAQGEDRGNLQAYAPYEILLRPNLVRLVNCKNIKLDGVTFQNSASWNVHLSLSDDIQVHGVTIFNTAWAQNGDGIDIDSCRNVTLTDCHINAGDDAICLKSGKDEAGRQRGRPTENVTIERCTVGTGHGGVVIGSEMSGGVRHVTVKDCVFNGTDNGLRFKSTRGRGGVVYDVTVDNVKMSNIGGVAILFDLFYAANGKPGAPRLEPDETTPSFSDFKISNVTCDGAKRALQIRGLPEMPLQNISLSHVKIHAKTAGFVADAKGLVFNDVHIDAADGSKVTVEKSVGLSQKDISGFSLASNAKTD